MGKTRFSAKWLSYEDLNNDKVSLYLTSIEDTYKAKCTWCTSIFDISSRGFLSIKDHSKTKKHVDAADIHRGRNKIQTTFTKISNGSENVEKEKPKGNPNTQRTDNARSFAVFVQSEKDKGEPLTLSDKVMKAQARFYLSAAENQISYSAVERQLELMPLLDPESEVRNIFIYQLNH